MTTDLEIWAKGNFLVALTEQPGPMPNARIDALCEHLTKETDGVVRWDWHAIGGRPYLLYLGDYEVAKRTFLNEAYVFREAAQR
jgi:hypothetical protein